MSAPEDGGGSMLSGVGLALPTLARAAELGRRAGGVGFDWSAAREVREKVLEELAELDAAVAEGAVVAPGGPARGAGPAVVEELGDLLFAIASWGRHLGVDPDAALTAANAKFERRFGWMERTARERAVDLGALTPAEWEQLWRESKAAVG